MCEPLFAGDLRCLGVGVDTVELPRGRASELAGVAAALIGANYFPDCYLALTHTPIVGSLDLSFLVNEIFMTFFFGIAAVEITDSVMLGGCLNPPRKAIPPLWRRRAACSAPSRST